MRSFLLAFFLTAIAPLSAQAQQLIGSYYATLGPHDFYNSSGTRLGDFGAIIQQDRANYHRFGIRDGNDDGDPVFGNRNNRGLIPSMIRLGSGGQDLRNWVLRGNQAYVYVEIYGYGSTPQYIVVHQGAG